MATASYEGRTGDELARQLGLPRVDVFEAVTSTMDLAHELAAAGSPAGTLVLADAQRSGRGRAGRRWTSEPGAGLWMTLVERPNDPSALDVLSLRIGLGVARVLDRFATAPVGLKWPNDLYLLGGKLGGILVESRWRNTRPDWVAIGVGINVRRPADVPQAAGLGERVSRLEVLGELIPAIRAAAQARGRLTPREVAAFAERDVAAGRTCREPRAGRVAGIADDGSLLVVTAGGTVRCREGSLLLDEEVP
ncbi:MAG TPA: biotin--[acetyl-CoA-carboxylase] ligase [Gemmatimonadaceae bacterium]